MSEHAHPNADRTLQAQLVLHVDRTPVSGWLRCERGREERFVGWLGFVEALRRLAEAQPHERS
jgi:hypothetical protein